MRPDLSPKKLFRDPTKQGIKAVTRAVWGLTDIKMVSHTVPK